MPTSDPSSGVPAGRPSVVVTTPSDCEVRVVRTFDAPPQVVWDCHTDPALVSRWLLGPPGWTMPVCDIDLRVGGTYRYVWRNEADGAQFGFRGEYREIDAPHRLVHTERFDVVEDMPPGSEGYPDGEALCTLELAERAGRTTLTLTMRYPTQAVRDAALETGMTDGMAQSYDRLAALAGEALMAARAAGAVATPP